ncbi:unnamed protein product [Effrenium voratum]|uniref:RlmI-like PUA domain-containing protein n=1 Tax=Effrenium voratum TaxID=2562239 RepID=A0AA36JFT2_9DINO|nr:unnamed protein product [Effrenium voratum]
MTLSASRALSRRIARSRLAIGHSFSGLSEPGEASRPRLIMTPRISEKRGGDARVSKQMPWIFRNEAANVEELRGLGTAALVNVESSEGRELGIAMCNLTKGGSTGVNVLARMLSDNVDTSIDLDFFRARVLRALEHRTRCWPDSKHYRLINGEGDLLPGVLCDRYGDVLCLQFTALAAEVLLQEDILNALEAVLAPKAVVLRYDARTDRLLEKASIKQPELVRGSSPGLLECPTPGFLFVADPFAEGWSSGAFFAERRLRELLAGALEELTAPNKSARRTPGKPKLSEPVLVQPKVLSLFGESSGISAAAKGAKVTCAVASGSAKEAEQALRLLAERNQCQDHVTYCSLGEEPRLEELGDQCKAFFDVVSLEPPALAPTYGRLEEGARLYTAWCGLAAAACKPGGLLLVACRSRTMSPVRLMRCINMGIWSAGRQARLVHRSAHAGLDSPIHFALQDTNQFQLVALRLSEGYAAS